MHAVVSLCVSNIVQSPASIHSMLSFGATESAPPECMLSCSCLSTVEQFVKTYKFIFIASIQILVRPSEAISVILCRGGFKHVQHVWPNRDPTERGRLQARVHSLCVTCTGPNWSSQYLSCSARDMKYVLRFVPLIFGSQQFKVLQLKCLPSLCDRVLTMHRIKRGTRFNT